MILDNDTYRKVVYRRGVDVNDVANRSALEFCKFNFIYPLFVE